MYKRLLCQIVLSLSLIACNDKPQDTDNFAAIVKTPSAWQHGKEALKDKEMLFTADTMTPAEWLLARYQATPKYDKARTKQYYNKLLASIQLHVHENKRVIANRIVQMTNKLNENGMKMNQEVLLNSFANRLAHSERMYVFGEILDNYSNIRSLGMTHQEAMTKLFVLLEG